MLLTCLVNEYFGADTARSAHWHQLGDWGEVKASHDALWQAMNLLTNVKEVDTGFKREHFSPVSIKRWAATRGHLRCREPETADGNNAGLSTEYFGADTARSAHWHQLGDWRDVKVSHDALWQAMKLLTNVKEVDIGFKREHFSPVSIQNGPEPGATSAAANHNAGLARDR
ncbi:hypothetical protein MMC07_006241 [Pseudocyphellaria aurata]|nr:hypothetical protein [Pseudocyphellaria aurata]